MKLTGAVNAHSALLPGEVFMNEKFFALPEEKQQRIRNAGYRVFSQNSYRKSPMSEIAEEAGISKSLPRYAGQNVCYQEISCHGCFCS